MNGLVVINYNDYKNTINFINSIKKWKCINHIVVVDNCSTDDSYIELSKLKNIDLIKNISNKGYGSGINLGSKYLINNYDVKNIIVSNTDIVINSENDIKKMLSYLNDEIVLVGPTILEHGNLNRGWMLPSIMQDAILNIPIIHRKLRKKMLFYDDSHYCDDVSFVEVISGCFFIITAHSLEKIDFFDENIFLYYEENVIATKLKKIGLKTIVVNDVEIIHNHSITIDNSINRIKKYKILKKSQKYFHKNYSKKNIFGIIFLYITDKIMLIMLYIVGRCKK